VSPHKLQHDFAINQPPRQRLHSRLAKTLSELKTAFVRSWCDHDELSFRRHFRPGVTAKAVDPAPRATLSLPSKGKWGQTSINATGPMHSI
jgi:hypothetical protein